MKKALLLLIFVFSASSAFAIGSTSGFCEQGNQTVSNGGTTSSTKVQKSYPQCTITVYVNGVTPPVYATLYSDNATNPTPLSNPFIASTNGAWTFFAANGTYDVVKSNGSPAFPAPITIYGVSTFDPSVATGLVRDCSSPKYGAPTATAYVKITACLADLPAVGGTAVATGLNGAQSITGDITLGPYQVLQLSGAGTYTLTNATFILLSGARIEGMGPCRINGNCTTIRRASGTRAMITATGTAGSGHITGFSLSNFFLDGGNTAGHGIVLDYVDSFRIENVTASYGGASNALRFLDEVWDFWVIDSSFTVWGDSSTPTIQLSGLNGGAQITDGHWIANQLGEVGNGNPVLVANGFVLQQRFVDNKFHTTGTGMQYMVDWSGYRSDFIGSTFQADEAATSGGMVRIKNADNRIIGGGFNDVANGNAIQVLGSGDVVVVGVTFRGSGSGSAIVADASSTGRITVSNNDIVGLATGYNFSSGSSKISIGPSTFSGVTTEVDAATVGATWGDFNNGKGTATFGGANLPSARSAGTINPVFRLGGNTATNSNGYQGIYIEPKSTVGGQVNESIGLGTGWLSGFGSINGTNIEHSIAWGYSADTMDLFGVYSKNAATPINATTNRVWTVRPNGDSGPRNNIGQHLVTFAAGNDIAGTLVIGGGGTVVKTFTTAYTAAPVCVANDAGGARAVQVQTTTTQLTVTGTIGAGVYYICMGNPN